jgi:type II secretory pathway pseudopilin PulG
MRQRGFTLVEFFTVIAALVIVLGLMVSLARYVRSRSAEQLARQLMDDLGQVLERYVERYDDVPAAPPLIDDAVPPTAQEERLDERSAANNRAWVRAMQQQILLSTRASDDPRSDPLGQLPIWLYDERSLRDPWGTPIVLMAGQHPLIGMSAGDRPFLVSAGADRRFLTRQDNLYSYEGRSTFENARDR